MKKLFAIAILAIASLLTGCAGVIETGNVGVRTSFGKIDLDEVGEGFYTNPFSSVLEYTARETSVEVIDLQPRAKDNLTLKDLDVSVYYTMAPEKIADFSATHKMMSASLTGDGDMIRPGYILLENQARGVIYDSVSRFDSMTLHQNRQALEADIMKNLRAELEKSDPGYFKITRVVIRGIQTDPQVEDSIRKSVAKDKEFEAAEKDVQVKKKMAAANLQLAESLTPAFLQHEYIGAIAECAKRQGCTLIVGGGNSVPLINLPK